LHVIDSLGLKVDYISGTSMGAIIGAFYATGYNAKEIEDIALSVDWEGIFGNKPDLGYVHVGKRKTSGKFVAELPVVNNRLKFETGLVEGQRMWNLLQELFFHVRDIDWYNEFPIPFACIAANIETGEAVIMNKDDIVNALRASVAIPAVFTAVERDGMTLLDGGVVNNLPVDIVKEMGADFVIGIYVSQGLKQAEKLKSPVEVIYQMGLFQAEQMLRVNKEQTDIFILPDLDGFTSSSFSDVQEIIERGK
jgi:NTE family protein